MMGRGISLFSIHFVSSLPMKVISDVLVELGDWPWVLRIGKERVREIRRQRLKILINDRHIFHTQFYRKYQIYRKIVKD